MGQAFNSWAQSSAGQEAIKSFVEYTKQNLPLIGQIFGNTFKGIFNLMKAFAPNTHSILESLAQMSEKFASWRYCNGTTSCSSFRCCYCDYRFYC